MIQQSGYLAESKEHHMKHRFIRLSIALGLCLIFALLAGLVLHTPPTEAAGNSALTSSMDQTGSAVAACGGDFTLVTTSLIGLGGDVVWGDYDDDGDLDILLSGYADGGSVTEVWRNDGGDLFTQAITVLTGVYQNSVAWGDYDDDGDLDILLAGISDSGYVTEVWRNEDGLAFTQAITTPTGVSGGSVEWGDYDDDGDLDILLAGYSNNGIVTEVWRNEDGLAFTQAITTPTGIQTGNATWGDYDEDGDLDILLTGFTGSIRTTEVWRNDGGGTFSLASSAPTAITLAKATWGDYDNDGDLDILLAGMAVSSDKITEVWRNDGGDTFTLASSAPTGIYGDVAWGDYDDDGDLDILLSGGTDTTYTTEIWRNDGGDTFTQAITSPTGVINSSVAWGDYDDDGDLDILLSGGTLGGDKTTEVWNNPRCPHPRRFTQVDTTPTGIQNGEVAWGDYDNDGDLDILLTGSGGGGHVTEVWRNDSGSFTLASTDPTDANDSSVAWGDYDDDGDLDILLAGMADSGPTTEIWRNEDGLTFSQAVTTPTGVSQSSVAWGDYDDDGDLDILLAGRTSSNDHTTEVWRNENGVTFTQAITTPTGVWNGSVAWGDYDDDGDLDILLAGFAGWSNGGFVTEVWRNDGSDTFVQASTDPTGIDVGAAVWGDYDHDGDLDILLSGTVSGDRVTEVWRNNGGDAFTLASTDPTNVNTSSVAWGDYDDDGDLDILLAGHTGSGPVTEVWRNEGGDSFTRASSAPTGVYYNSVAWGDYDHDGDLDILLAGDSGSGLVTEIWCSGSELTYLPLAIKN